MVPSEDELTPRERRALREKERRKSERFKAGNVKESGRAFMKRAALPAVVVLIIAVAAGAVVLNNALKEECPGHEHATMHMFVDGERVSFQHPVFDMRPQGEMRVRSHFHQPDDVTWHLEGGCADMGEALQEIHVSMSSGQIELEGAHEQLGQAGTYEASGNKTLRVFLYDYDSNTWTERSVASILDHQLRDGERLLVAYGDYTDDEILEMKAGIPFYSAFDPKPEPETPSGSDEEPDEGNETADGEA